MDPRTLNMEMYEGMGFDKNNYSPILPVSQATSQSWSPRLTSTPKLEEEQISNSSGPTHIRGKINRVNSFESAESKTKNVKRWAFQKFRYEGSAYT